MSDRMTAASLPGAHFGFAYWGRLTPEDAIARLRAYAEGERAAAQAVLDAPDEAFLVETYLGPHAQRKREVLQEPSGSEAGS